MRYSTVSSHKLKTIINRRGASVELKRFRLKLPFIDRDVMQEWTRMALTTVSKQQTVDWTGYFLNLLPWYWIPFLDFSNEKNARWKWRNEIDI